MNRLEKYSKLMASRYTIDILLLLHYSPQRRITIVKSIMGKDIINRSKYVLITHTPISTIKKEFYLKQINHKNLYQKIHSINNIKKKLLLKKYSIEFKSYNDYKHTGLKSNNKIESTNILFKKNR